MIGFNPHSSVLFVRGRRHRAENITTYLAGPIFVFRAGGGEENKIAPLLGGESRRRDGDRSPIAVFPRRGQHLDGETCAALPRNFAIGDSLHLEFLEEQ